MTETEADRRRSIRVGIVDDHEVFRLGLRGVLERTGTIEVVWATGTPHEAWSLALARPVDAVLVDVNLGGPFDGLEVSRQLTTQNPGLRVILISGLADEQRLARAGRAGAVGFLPKELSAEDMLTAIQELAAPRSRAGSRPARLEAGPGDRPIEPLSPRERQVLAEIRLGRTNREIAHRLKVSITTVNKHVHNVLRKLRVRNRSEAAIVAGSLLSRRL